MNPNPGPEYGQAVQDCPLKKKEKTWIAIQLIGEDDKPVPGARYQIMLTDGTTSEGTLDAQGTAQVNEIDPGSCAIAFPDLDQDAWQPV